MLDQVSFCGSRNTSVKRKLSQTNLTSLLHLTVSKVMPDVGDFVQCLRSAQSADFVSLTDRWTVEAESEMEMSGCFPALKNDTLEDLI